MAINLTDGPDFLSMVVQHSINVSEKSTRENSADLDESVEVLFRKKTELKNKIEAQNNKIETLKEKRVEVLKKLEPIAETFKNLNIEFGSLNIQISEAEDELGEMQVETILNKMDVLRKTSELARDEAVAAAKASDQKREFAEKSVKISGTFDCYINYVGKVKKGKIPLGPESEEKLNSYINQTAVAVQFLEGAPQKTEDVVALIEKGNKLTKQVSKQINRVKCSNLIETFEKMIPAINSGDIESVRKQFISLPENIVKEFSRIHWIECGSPTGKSWTESQRNRAHDDFGKVSFLNLDPAGRCVASKDEKIKSLNTYLVDLNKTLESYK